MPKFEPKNIQRELEAGLLWPVYWIYGPEKMKTRELIKRIEKTLETRPQTLDATTLSAAEITDSAQSLLLGGGIRFLVIQDAHAIKNPEPLEALFGSSPQSKAIKKEELPHVCVFISKDLDQRKKFSKRLIEKAACVSCDEVPEQDRAAWIEYLAKRKNLTLESAWIHQLQSLDPWSLDIIEQELEKFSIAKDPDVFFGNAHGSQSTQDFIDAFFTRSLAPALSLSSTFAGAPDEAIPLLGLLGWNTRQLALTKNGKAQLKLHPFVAERLRAWSGKWNQTEILELQEHLADLDFELKQTPKSSTGLWTELICRFCPPPSA